MSGSEHSISFAMDDSILASPNTHTTQNRVPSRIFFSPVEAEPPVLRLTSSNRLKVGRGTEDTDIDRYQSALSSRHQQAQTADPLDIPRTHSRGRQLETDKDKRKEYGSAQYQKHPKTSESRRQASKEHADLARYHLIKDVPSASCPLHESRSRSGARKQSSLGQKSSQTQLRSARDASRPRLQEDDLGRSASAQPKTRRKMSAPRPERGWAAQDVRVDRSVSATPGHERSRQGSKTPVPMILVSK